MTPSYSLHVDAFILGLSQKFDSWLGAFAHAHYGIL